MTAHQLIYTSCRRGIRGVNDGQQVFSYDAMFPAEHIASIASNVTYRAPDLPLGVPMTEALVPSFPRSFTFSSLGGQIDLALTTYLGKDYMGPTGRFGNFLSHHVVLDRLVAHPAELINSPVFRTSMEFDEVNSTEPPKHLLALEGLPQGDVSRDTVRIFLSAPGRWATFRRMAGSLLAGTTTGKRVVIHDHPEHVIQWIGALGYILPARLADQVSFSTYEYNPTRGSWRIVGVVADGTMYDPNDGATYVFDLATGIVPVCDVPEEFAEFLEVGLLIAPDGLLDFHSFLEAEFPGYQEADETLYGAFGLYQFGQGEFQPETLPAICEFLVRHGTDVQRGHFLDALLRAPDAAGLVMGQGTRTVLLGFLNRTVLSAMSLLELTFTAEGHLLDTPDPLGAVEVVWNNFHSQLANAYPGDRALIYRELVSYLRWDEVVTLFSVVLQSPGDASPKALFDEVIAVLSDPGRYAGAIAAYYEYATTSSDRAHLLRFIIAKGVSFPSAGTLVNEAISEIPYAPLSGDVSTYIQSVWRWALDSGVAMRQCERLWYLIVGLVLTSTKSGTKLASTIGWVKETAESVGLRPVLDTDEFVRWVVPHLVLVADERVTLSWAVSALGFRQTQPLVDTLWDAAFRHFDKGTWFKVADCIFMYRDDQLLDLFAQSCKKLSNREIAALKAEAEIRYRGDARAIRNWETIQAVAQSTTLRTVKAWIGKRGEGHE